MFEIEHNFRYEEEKIKELLKDADFVGKKVFTDIYYDNNSFDLTGKNIWLRQREGSFELKLPLEGVATDKFEEIEDEQRIKEHFKFDNRLDLKEQLLESGYAPFCVCVTTRNKYKKDDFNIDIDDAAFDDEFIWRGMEIELMIDNPSKAEEASKKILRFGEKYGLSQIDEGKVSEYLKQKKPSHFKSLVDQGIFRLNS